DLRVLAAKVEPAGYIVPLDNPRALGDTNATITALVVDPKGEGAIVTVTGEACPDFIDTITAASGMTTKLCPGKDVTDRLPEMDRPLIETEALPPGASPPVMGSTIQYEPTAMFGLSADQLDEFFKDPVMHPSGNKTIDIARAYNR